MSCSAKVCLCLKTDINKQAYCKLFGRNEACENNSTGNDIDVIEIVIDGNKIDINDVDLKISFPGF